MVAEEDICKYYQPRNVYVWGNLAFFPLFVAATLAFSYKFVCQLKAQKKNNDTLSQFIHVYIILALLLSFYGLYVSALESFRQKNNGLSLAFCGFCNWLGLSLTSGSYVTLQHILFIRLYTAFDKTKWAVGGRMRIAVRVFHSVAFGMSFAMVTLDAAVSDCFYETKSVGIHWPVYWCAPRPKFSFTTYVNFWIGAFVIIVGNAALAYMYVTRLRLALLGTTEMRVKKHATMASLSLSESQSAPQRESDGRSQAVIRKSTVVAVVSILSTLFAFLLVPLVDFVYMIYLDVLFNEVLLYCLYAFGDDLYNKVFARCHCCVDPFIPDNAFDDVALDTAQNDGL